MDFLKHNAAAQASQSAAIAQEIAEKHGGAAKSASPSLASAWGAPGAGASAKAAVKEPEPVGPSGLPLLFLSKTLLP